MPDINQGANSTPREKYRGIYSMMARYQALRGVKPVGPHRRLADDLLTNITCECESCKGTGYFFICGGMVRLVCPICNSLGETYRISIGEVLALRQKVLDHYPDAETPHWRPARSLLSEQESGGGT